MIRILEERSEKKKLYKYTTLKLKVPKDMELDSSWGREDEIPKIRVVENGIVEIVFKQVVKSSDSKV